MSLSSICGQVLHIFPCLIFRSGHRTFGGTHQPPEMRWCCRRHQGGGYSHVGADDADCPDETAGGAYPSRDNRPPIPVCDRRLLPSGTQGGLPRWARVALYAMGRKRLHILASALGEILKVYKGRREATSISYRTTSRRRTPTSILLRNWLRFSRHVFKTRLQGHLAGALLTYFQVLNRRGRSELAARSTSTRRIGRG